MKMNLCNIIFNQFVAKIHRWTIHQHYVLQGLVAHKKKITKWVKPYMLLFFILYVVPIFSKIVYTIPCIYLYVVV